MHTAAPSPSRTTGTSAALGPAVQQATAASAVSTPTAAASAVSTPSAAASAVSTPTAAASAVSTPTAAASARHYAPPLRHLPPPPKVRVERGHEHSGARHATHDAPHYRAEGLV